MAGIDSRISFKFCSAGALVTYHVGISTTKARRSDCFMSIDHYLMLCRLFYGIEIMIVHPLSEVVLAPWNYIADITAFYSIIAIFFHQIVSMRKMALVITNGA